ncbi:MAG: Enoyl-CoA hydratase/isomerase [uncultured Sphingomonadaceae bacterium]|uniref:Enoyl-CoA hydratase/isomerase n=1 Tax=uncultured Sphingomonadaceae bacterium TaxID=169976 RepID=A0A6J4T3X7_9SPHN|nr:MAG: Enoyl-CoA hydratase/isomerase [uncultured Sphingomonadaceae bacterium]
MDDRIRMTIEGGVADVRLTRPDKMNALDPAMFDALEEAGDRLRGMAGLRAVVLSGEGRAFCAGLDLANFAGMADGAGRTDLGPRTHGPANRPQHVVLQWRALPVPVIAAVHGVAFGGGFQLALGADVRFVAVDAKLSVMEIKWGLVPDMGGALLMRELVRPDVLAELTYTGRVFDGAEAARLGLATRICDDPRAEALAFAREVAAKSPDAIRAAKRLLSHADEGFARRVLQAESDEQGVLIGSPNQVEAVRAGLEKRAASFRD